MIRWLGRALLALAGLAALAVALIWSFGPVEPMDLARKAAPLAPGTDLDAHFATAEARFDDIREPDTRKRVIWAKEAGAQTDLAVLYIHGFSATSEEIRPVPHEVARALGANLVLTRLAGHGRTGQAMAEVSAEDWMADVDEALDAARIAGREVLVIATSTGATLATAAALDPARMERVRAMVFVSPNFGLYSPAARILTWPAVRWWGPKVFGQTRGWEPRTPLQARYWTTSYPSVSVLPMAALVKHVMAQDLSAASVPLLVFQSRADQVVSPDRTAEAVARWGGPATLEWVTLGPGDDPSAHGIMGDILSPGQTQAGITRILDWAATL